MRGAGEGKAAIYGLFGPGRSWWGWGPVFTARADRASRLTQTLPALLAEHRRRWEEILPLRQLLKGSVYQLQTRCGKPSCPCAAADGPLHTPTVLCWSGRGKTHWRTLPTGGRARRRQLAENCRRFRQTRAALVKLHRRMLAAIDRLEGALRLPPPQPASRPPKK